MATELNIARLSALVRSRRGDRGLRETAEEIGNVSPSTLSRVENGRIAPDMETFLALCDWLEVHPAQLLQSPHSLALDTPQELSLLLRGDERLDPAMAQPSKGIANALAALMEAAYRDLAKRNNG